MAPWDWVVTNAGDLPPSPQPYAIDAGLPAKGGIALCALSTIRLEQPLLNGGGGPVSPPMARVAVPGAANAVRPMDSVPPNANRPTTRKADARNVTVAEAVLIASLKPKEMLGLHRRSSQRLSMGTLLGPGYGERSESGCAARSQTVFIGCASRKADWGSACQWGSSGVATRPIIHYA